MADQIVRCLLGDGASRVVAAITTGVSREAARRHGAVAGAAVALSRAATSGLLLATLTKGGERVTVEVAGDGPLGPLLADATDEGNVRVYAKHSDVFVPAGAGRRTRLCDAVGRRGVVNVIRDLGLRERYTGQAPIVTGEIDEDVENYLRQSEQIDSALGCDALLSDTSEIQSAGGLLVQTLPGADVEPVVREMQHRLRTGALDEALAGPGGEPPDAVGLARAVLGRHAGRLQVLDTRPLRFFCPCSEERVAGMLALLDPSDLDAMIEEGRAEVVCNFCAEKYVVTRETLEKARSSREPRGVS